MPTNPLPTVFVKNTTHTHISRSHCRSITRNHTHCWNVPHYRLFRRGFCRKHVVWLLCAMGWLDFNELKTVSEPDLLRAIALANKRIDPRDGSAT